MKLLVYSDLHLEFAQARDHFRVPEDLEFDVAILAGDIHKHSEGIDWAAKEFSGRPVIYVSGNHEAYGTSLASLMPRLHRRAKDCGTVFIEDDGVTTDSVSVLDNRSVVISGVRFLGSTLWTDFRLFGSSAADVDAAMRAARAVMTDFDGRVRLDDRLEFTPADSVRLFKASSAWLAQELATPFTGPTVVVTHHLPSFASVAERYRTDLVSAGFASHLDELVEQADIWIHGHTHCSFDYRLGGCRVICNPRGYPDRQGSGSENPEFNPGLVIEI